ncbi:MAG: FAD-binding protein [Alphaproteobacteria bacterium]|nr:FAD-binding protein [Alphaproteobacteria bacterium]
MSDAAYARADADSAVVAELTELLGDRLSTTAAVREHHGHGEDYYAPYPPDAVCFPHSTEEVAEIVKICAAHHTPVIPFGTGTSVEGHVTAPHGGVTIDLMQMNNVIEVNAEDLDCRVQAGVTRKQLNEYLRDTGLFFPIDPGADASLGGMAATRASGTNAVRYGTMRENVLGLTVVTADGRIVKTGGRAKKSSAGYDLTRIFVGSEGTLGVITEVHVKLYGIPEKIASAVCQFPSTADAVDSVILTIQSGIPVARIELMDSLMMDWTIDYSKLDGYEAKPTLFYEFHGTEAGVEEQTQQVRAIIDDFGGSAFQWTSSTEERNKLWQARHDVYHACIAHEPGKQGISTDVCVPISRLAECIAATEQDTRASGFEAPMVGHVGDGNFHSIFLVDIHDDEEMKRAKECNDRIVQRALALGGTCTGEHGIGVGKIDFLVAEHGEAVSLMRTIKRALDPDNIMNPGKVLRV